MKLFKFLLDDKRIWIQIRTNNEGSGSGRSKNKGSISTTLQTVQFFFLLLLWKYKNISRSRTTFRIVMVMDKLNWNKSGFHDKNRAGIFKPLWSPGIDAKASIPPAYAAWRAGTITLFLLGA